MTQPQPVQPNGGAQIVQLNGGAKPVPGPDGKAHVGVVLQCGAMQVMAVLPPDVADGFVDQLAQAVRLASAEARRQNTGLLIPPAQLAAVRSNMAAAMAGNGHRGPSDQQRC